MGRTLLPALLFSSLLQVGCGDDDGTNPPTPTTFTVTVEDISPAGTLDTPRAMGTVPLSPGVFAVYTGANPAFTEGSLADEGTERIAEDGFPGPPLPGTKSTMLVAADNVKQSGVFQSPGGPDDGPAIFSGESATFTFTAVPGDLLTLETMFVQSNDWFYTFDGLALFDGSGGPISGDVTDRIQLYDAGTEEDTPPGTGDFQKPLQDPMAMNVGPAESVPVQTAAERHPDFTIPSASAVLRITITPES